jgi:hypothetical protein
MPMSAARSAGELIRLRVIGEADELELASPRVIIAGYTGRNAAAVAEHIAELAAVGIAPPESVPAFYEMDHRLLTTARTIEVDGAFTSGEVEPVLVRHRGRYFLGVGSDHTDRDVERIDVAKSKAMCGKPLSRSVMALPADLDQLDWDAVSVESYVDGVLYQSGTLAALRTPTDVLGRLADVKGDTSQESDLVVFGGTLPLLNGTFLAGGSFRCSMTLRPGTALDLEYQIIRRTQ